MEAVQYIVGVHVEPVGQGPLLPTVQGISGGNVWVLIQRPPHGFVEAVQYIVGVHVAPVGQGPLLPTVQGISGGNVWVVIQRPPHVEVCVQIDPVGHGSPLRVHCWA